MNYIKILNYFISNLKIPSFAVILYIQMLNEFYFQKMLFIKLFIVCFALITSSQAALQVLKRVHNFNATVQLNKHNQFRSKHGVPPLTLNSALSSRAQAYAQKLSATKSFQHSGAKGFGENLYMTTGTYTSPAATNSWYNEIKFYDFNSPGFSSKTGHFTQVIWRETTTVGFGFQDGYFVANYAKPGNFLGQFETNVLKLKINHFNYHIINLAVPLILLNMKSKDQIHQNTHYQQILMNKALSGNHQDQLVICRQINNVLNQRYNQNQLGLTCKGAYDFITELLSSADIDIVNIIDLNIIPTILKKYQQKKNDSQLIKYVKVWKYMYNGNSYKSYFPNLNQKLYMIGQSSKTSSKQLMIQQFKKELQTQQRNLRNKFQSRIEFFQDFEDNQSFEVSQSTIYHQIQYNSKVKNNSEHRNNQSLLAESNGKNQEQAIFVQQTINKQIINNEIGQSKIKIKKSIIQSKNEIPKISLNYLNNIEGQQADLTIHNDYQTVNFINQQYFSPGRRLKTQNIFIQSEKKPGLQKNKFRQKNDRLDLIHNQGRNIQGSSSILRRQNNNSHYKRKKIFELQSKANSSAFNQKQSQGNQQSKGLSLRIKTQTYLRPQFSEVKQYRMESDYYTKTDMKINQTKHPKVKKLSQYSQLKVKTMSEINNQLFTVHKYILELYRKHFTSPLQFNRFRRYCFQQNSILYSSKKLKIQFNAKTMQNRILKVEINYFNISNQDLPIQTTYKVPKCFKIQKHNIIKKKSILNFQHKIQHLFSVHIESFPLQISLLSLKYEQNYQPIVLFMPITILNFIEYLVVSPKEFQSKYDNWSPNPYAQTANQNFCYSGNYKIDKTVIDEQELANIFGNYIELQSETDNNLIKSLGALCRYCTSQNLEFLIKITFKMKGIFGIEIKTSRKMNTTEDAFLQYYGNVLVMLMAKIN